MLLAWCGLLDDLSKVNALCPHYGGTIVTATPAGPGGGALATLFRNGGVVRLQRLGRPGQEIVVQARQPEAQRGAAQHQRPGLPFGVGEGPHLGIGSQPGLHQLGNERAGVPLDAPVVDADRHVEQPGIAAREIEVDETAHQGVVEGAGEQHVIAEQVAVRRTRGQALPGRGGAGGLLFGQFRRQQAGLAFVQEGHDLGGGFQPPGQPAQIGLAYREVLGGQMGAGQRGAGQCAMRCAGRGFVAAR